MKRRVFAKFLLAILMSQLALFAASTQTMAAPSAPSNVSLSANSLGGQQLRVTWSPPGGASISSYEILIFESTNKDQAIGSVQVDGNQTSIIISDYVASNGALESLVNGTFYTVKIVAIDSTAVASIKSEPSQDVAPYDFPESVGNTIVERSGIGSLKVSWNVPNSDGGNAISGYRVTCTPACSSAAYLNAVDTELDISDLDPETKYTFKVQAGNARGFSTFSSTISSTALSPLGAINSPSISIVAQKNALTAKWNSIVVAGASEVNYRVELVNANNGSTIGSPILTGALVQAYTNVAVGQRYQVRVTTIADGEVGSSSLSGISLIPATGVIVVDPSETTKDDTSSEYSGELSSSGSSPTLVDVTDSPSSSPSNTLSPSTSAGSSTPGISETKGSSNSSKMRFFLALVIFAFTAIGLRYGNQKNRK